MATRRPFSACSSCVVSVCKFHARYQRGAECSMGQLGHLTCFSFCFFKQLYCPIGVSPVGNSGCFPRGEPAATESRYSTYGACWVFQCFHNPPNSNMNYRFFNVHTGVNACGCTQECTDTVRESALKVDSGRKTPCRTGESNLCQRRAGPTLYQPSNTPLCAASPVSRYFRKSDEQMNVK